MLTDEEKTRILLEERYRAEVRSTSGNHSGTGAIAQFANSNFGIWLLSAILITGLGGAITWYQEYRDESRSTKDRIERLDIEIAYRLSQQIGLLDEEFRLAEASAQIPQPSFTNQGRLGESLTNQGKSSLLSLYPEFKDLSVSGLMAELRRHIGGPERKQVDYALLPLTNGTLTKDAEGMPKIVAGRIFGQVLSRRRDWLDASFPYTDCSVVTPFC